MDAMHLHRHRENARIPLSLSLSLAGWPKEGARERLRAMPCGFVVRPSLRPSAVPPISLSLLHYQNGGPAPRRALSVFLLCSAPARCCGQKMQVTDGWTDNTRPVAVVAVHDEEIW